MRIPSFHQRALSYPLMEGRAAHAHRERFPAVLTSTLKREILKEPSMRLPSMFSSGKNHFGANHNARLSRCVDAIAQELESRVLLSTISLIADMSPNPPRSAQIANPANIGSELFFTAQQDSSGDELWKTDGTTAGTVLVKDINPGAASSNPTDLVNVGNVIFFAANDGTDGTELWKTDGTAAGTVMVKDIVPGSGSSNPTNLTNINGTLFFSATDASGNASLWKSDGTAAGTVELAAVGASDLTNVNGTLFFVGSDAAHGIELWKSDASAAGTVLVDDINPGAASSYPAYLTAVGSELFFSIDSGPDGLPGMWKTDGTAAGTVEFKKNIYAGGFYDFNGIAYFGGPDIAGGSQDDELWKTDGTPNGTVQITRAAVPGQDFIPAFFWNVGGTLVVGQYNNFQDASYLYSTDGTQVGTVPLNGTLGDGAQGYPPSAAVVNGILYYNGDGGGALYQSNGTAAGTGLVDPTANPQVTAIQVLGQAGNTLVFAGTTAPQNGTASGVGESLYGTPLSPAAPTGSATLARVDSTTEGSWRGVYGSQGYDLLGTSIASLPSYAQVSPANASQWTWQDPTSDGRALQDPSPSTSRTAATDYSGGSFSLDVNLTDGQTHQVALYLVDFDRLNRSETVAVSDTASGTVLNTQTIKNFQNGQWLVYDLFGNVTITLTNTGPQNAVASGLMFDPANVTSPAASASFVKLDTTTLGGWIGTYGSGGYSVVGGANNLPASAQLSVTGAQEYTWADPAADPRAPQIGPGELARTAATYYAAGSFTVDLNLTDGQTHQVALEVLDYDAFGRAETVQITNATTGKLLDSRTVSNFQGGQYLVYDLTGHLKITFINNGPANAVLSGIFVDPKPTTASYVRTDSTTEGQWTGVYGSQGYDVFGGSESLPSYANIMVNNAQYYEWAAVNSDATELQTSPGSTNRIAATDYSNAGGFSINLSLSDGQMHQVALYILDWDNQKRAENIDITNSVTGAFLAGDLASGFSHGQYIVFDVTGNVTISISNAGGLNEVVSGIFIDPVKSGTASFVKTDTTTEGSWSGVYGSTGAYVVDGQASGVPNSPYGLLPQNRDGSPTELGPMVYSSSTSDPRALQTASGSTTRVEATDYAPTSFMYTIDLTDGKTHQLAVYVADYDNQGRSETVQIADANTGVVLSSQFVSNFQNGKYLVWDISGNVNIIFTQVTGPNAVDSGLFLD
jgi:ELWxxDGT repeat protein